MIKNQAKILLVSVKFLSAILGLEMAAPILWAPRISAFFLQENLHVHKIPRFRGGILGWEKSLGDGDFLCALKFIRADFWEVVEMKHFSVKKRVFSEKGGGI